MSRFVTPAPEKPATGRTADQQPAAEKSASWLPPSAVAPRGTLLLLPGRGEHPLVYERFGRRLAADGYVVHALETAPGATPDEVARAATEATGPDPARPVVLVGSDTGALQALHTAAAWGDSLPPGALLHAPAPDGAVLAGSASTSAPGRTTAPDDNTAEEPSPWERELEARTACPTHRARLNADDGFTRGALGEPVPEHLRRPATTTLPVLVLHGAADPVTPLPEARGLAARLGSVTLGVLRNGRHDVLNDASHRTTAATVVLWLERLREGAVAPPVITLETRPEADGAVGENAGPNDTHGESA